jgi:hypothetical protein
MNRRFIACTLFGLLFAISATAQQPNPPTPGSAETQQPEDIFLPGDWAPELLDAVLTSPNPDARDLLLEAAFAAGPAIVPQLEAALKDDRTAEFAAQSLAFIGGDRGFEILAGLVKDPRDLNLRRFFYGALGEFQNPKATQVLLDVVARSDAEPDRTVTEAAILALTARSDLSLLAALRQAEKQVKDVVIRDDLDNALDVIEARGRYLASPEGKNEGVSAERAIHTYFYPALKSPPAAPQPPAMAAKGAKPGNATASPSPQPKPEASVEIQKLTLSPDKSRALARAVFENPVAVANYDIVLQKQYGDWTVASVWLGAETEKPQPAPRPASAPRN